MTPHASTMASIPLVADHLPPPGGRRATVLPGAGRNHDLHARSVERVILAMRQRLDRPMSNDEMAAIACLSACHFNRVFHRLTGIPPTQFLYALRLQQAKQLLISSDLSITDVCFDVGYQSLGTFVSRFNELVGLPPKAFRRFARSLAAIELGELRPFLTGRRSARADGRAGTLTGAIVNSRADAGIAFVGLFRRSIPERWPAACALTLDNGAYSIAVPSDGRWFAFSVAIPWTAPSSRLLMLEGLPRGRSGVLSCADGRCLGDATIVLRPPHVLDPPVLATIPLVLNRYVGIGAAPGTAGAHVGAAQCARTNS